MILKGSGQYPETASAPCCVSSSARLIPPAAIPVVICMFRSLPFTTKITFFSIKNKLARLHTAGPIYF